MQLPVEKSLCEKNQKEIVSKDKKRSSKHHAHNRDLNDVRQYQLDGDLVEQQSCCDYLLLNDTKKQAYFIELKGSDILKGIEQLECGVKLFASHLPEYEILYRLVHTRAKTHNVHSSTFKKFKEKHGKKFRHEKNTLEEDI